MKRRDTKLYNILFPSWMFYLWPTVLWPILLVGNFAWDSVVLLGAMALWRWADKGQVWRRSILPVWVIGFLADFAGALLVAVLYFGTEALFQITLPFTFPGGMLCALPGLVLAGVLIYFLNRRFSFRKTGLDEGQVKKLSLALAIATAPYTLLIPIEWLYG